MAAEEKTLITREKHPGRVAHAHKLAAYMKKREEEILRNKEPFSVQSTVHSNYIYVYGVGILAVLAIGVYVFFAYKTFQPKNIVNEKKINHKNDVLCFRSYI